MDRPIYAVMLGESKPFMERCYNFLAHLDFSLDLGFFPAFQLSPKQRALIQGTLCYQAWKNGFFLTPDHFEFTWWEQEPGPEVSVAKWVLVPDYVQTTKNGEDTDVYLEFGDPQMEWIEAHESQDVKLLDEDIEQQILAYEPLSVMEPVLLLDWLADTVRAWLPQKGDPGPEVWACYHALQAAELWRIDIPESHRNLLETALHQLMQDANLPFSHLIASLYKRYYVVGQEGLSEDIRAGLAYWQERQGGIVRILPPLESTTVTYFVVTYNRLAMLKRNIEGILSQTSRDWKLIILDHGSTDGTQAYWQEVVQREPERVRVVRQPVNHGVEALHGYFQEIMATVEGELFCFVPDDDWVLPHQLEQNQALLARYPWVAMTYGVYQLVDLAGTPSLSFGPLYSQPCVTRPEIEMQRLILTGICPQAAVLRKEVLRFMAKLDPMVPDGVEFSAQDYLCGILLQSQFEAAYTPELVACITAHSGSAGAGQEYGKLQLSILTSAVNSYEGLRGVGTYPRQLAEQYFDFLLQSNIQTLYRAILSDPDQAVFDARLQKKSDFFSKAYGVKSDLNRRPLSAEPHLFSAGQNPYQPLPGM